MFRLTKDEFASLRSQLVILEKGRGRYPKYPPYAFTSPATLPASPPRADKRHRARNRRLENAAPRNSNGNLDPTHGGPASARSRRSCRKIPQPEQRFAGDIPISPRIPVATRHRGHVAHVSQDFHRISTAFLAVSHRFNKETFPRKRLCTSSLEKTSRALRALRGLTIRSGCPRIARDIHDPDVAQVLAPDEVQILSVGGEPVDTKITIPAREVGQLALPTTPCGDRPDVPRPVTGRVVEDFVSAPRKDVSPVRDWRQWTRFSSTRGQSPKARARTAGNRSEHDVLTVKGPAQAPLRPGVIGQSKRLSAIGGNGPYIIATAAR